jgi:hypothetical protein
MKLKMYFLAAGYDVHGGPYFTVEQAIKAKENFPIPLRALLRVMKLNGDFVLFEV